MIEVAEDEVDTKNPGDFYLGAEVLVSRHMRYHFKGVVKATFFDKDDNVQYAVEALPGQTTHLLDSDNFVVVSLDYLEKVK